MLTLSLYSALMISQLEMEGSISWGMVMTFVTFSLAEGGMGSPTSFKRSLVLTLLFPFAKKLCFLYTQYLGLISRDELFWMQARTLNPSPVKQTRDVNTTLCMRIKSVNNTLRALTLEEACFFEIHIHGYCSWGEKLHFLILRLVLWCLTEGHINQCNTLRQQQRETNNAYSLLFWCLKRPRPVPASKTCASWANSTMLK